MTLFTVMSIALAGDAVLADPINTSDDRRPVLTLPTSDVGETTPYVVGGTNAPEGRWPDAVYVSMGSSACTGTLIHPKWILTAAHCLPGVQTVLIGTTDNGDMFAPADSLGEARRVRAVREVAHSANWQFGYDIALVELAEPVTHIRPRVIGRGCITDEYLYAGAEVVVVGWGALQETGSGFTNIQQEGTTFIGTPDCVEDDLGGIATGCNASVRPGGELGAGGEGVDARFGDSGGPLYLPTPKGTYVIGVTSRAYAGVDGAYPCRDGGIWTRPDAVMDWIEATIGEALPEPTCVLPPALELDTVRVAPGAVKVVDVALPDVDPALVRYGVLRQPLHGWVDIDARGRLTIAASQSYTGVDSFVFSVEQRDPAAPDAPAALSEIPVQVQVGGSGCSALPRPAGAPAALLGIAGVALTGRRRRP